MPEKVTFTAQPRTLVGKKVKKLRREGQVPANISGADVNSAAISVGRSAFVKLYDEVGDTGVVYLTVTGETKDRPVLIEDVALDPLSGELQHIVFKQVNLKEKISAGIPVELVGEADITDGTVITVHNEIEVEALPTDLPESFEIDISGLTEIGQAITFNQLSYDRSKVTLLLSEEELDTPVVIVQGQQAEVVEEEVAPVEGETPAEGAAPAEGEATAEASETPQE